MLPVARNSSNSSSAVKLPRAASGLGVLAGQLAADLVEVLGDRRVVAEVNGLHVEPAVVLDGRQPRPWPVPRLSTGQPVARVGRSRRCHR
jgi:hypothetical protein